jgi:tripartite-type tricarboxylate transporter receptor subunit TctC
MQVGRCYLQDRGARPVLLFNGRRITARGRVAPWSTGIVLSASLLFPAVALAQAPAGGAGYPVRTVRIVAPQPAGSGVDTYTRAIAQKLTETWGQQVIVDNRPGANGIIGIEQVIKAKPDGYTILAAFTSVLVINPHVYKALAYDVERDLTPVMQTITNSIALVVHPKLPVRTPKELIALAKARPNELMYGSNGVGNVSHLAAELWASETGVQLTHVPYKGATPAIQETIAGQVALTFPTLIGVSSHIRAGRLRLLATCGERRVSLFPDTPTMIESGFPRMIVTGWGGYMAPANTPREIISAFHRDAARVLQSAELRERLRALGSDSEVSTPEQFGVFLKSESDKWARVAKRAGIYQSQ